MREKIYTIPVNEAFENSEGCPLCDLYKKLEDTKSTLPALPVERTLNKNQRLGAKTILTLYDLGKRLPLP